MNVSLVYPPFHLESLYSLPPLGLINLATGLGLAGQQPTIHDAVLELQEGSLPLGPGLYQACAERILDASPKLVGFSAQCATYPAMIGVARELKRRDPGLFIVAGGHNASFLDTQTLERFPQFDAVVRSEGEVTFNELVGAVDAGRPVWDIPGVTSRRSGAIVRAPQRELIPRLDDLPLPQYSLAPRLDRYVQAYDLPRAIAILEVGRGCPHACVYCSESAMWRRRPRVFSVDRLVSEMRRLRDNEGAECFLLSYDQFTTDKDYVRRFCTAVIDAGLSGCGWHCISRLDTVDSELFALMRQAGCESMCYGIDSGSKRTLSFINKRIDESLLYQRVRETTEHGMTPTLSFIIGFPEEEVQDIDATLTLALKCGIQGNVSPLVQLPTVLPGTALHARYADRLAREVDTYFALGLEFQDGHRFAGDEVLIGSDPALFSSFYNLPCQGMDLKELALLAASFPLMIDFFPKTFHVLATALQVSPTRLFLQFLKRAHAVGDFEGPLTARHYLQHFPDFARTLLDAALVRNWPVLPQLLRYEALALEAAGAPSAPGPSDPGKPLRRGRLAVGCFDMDMEKVVADLKAGVVRGDYPASRCAVVFSHDGNRLDATKVNLFGKDVLELCDGDHTLDQIAEELRPRHGADLEQPVFVAHCRDAVDVFQRTGLLAAVA